MDTLSFWWLLIVLPALFVAGWLAARLEARQRSSAYERTRSAYLRGLGFLLNQQQDQAIDAFIEAVDRDRDTVDLQFALGNLFRRRGEFDRAVRLHENLLSLPNVSAEDAQRARFELGMDYFKAGLFDRVVTEMSKITSTYYRPRALEMVLQVHERLRQWSQAIKVAYELEQLEAASFSKQIAHYYCELALLSIREKTNDWTTHLQAARQAQGNPPRAILIEMEQLIRLGDHSAALAVVNSLADEAPDFIGLAAQKLGPLLVDTTQREQALASFQGWLETNPSFDLLEAVLLLARGSQMAILLNFARQHPTLLATQRLLEETGKLAEHQRLATVFEVAATTLQKPTTAARRFRCAACAFESRNFFWQCPGCQGWETMPAKRVGDVGVAAS